MSTSQFSSSFLSRYEPIRILGEGGMGTVHLMRQLRLDRLVAVKVVRPDSLSVEECQRLQREAQVLASLDHPNILAVHDVDIDQDMPFLVTEFVEGETLSGRIARRPGLTVDQAMKIVSQLLSGLKAAHRKGIIHRDLKPQNIFLTKTGKPKIGDFGLAKKNEMPSGTVAGAIMGSPPYMSPEQCRGFKATASSDLYSIGVMLFEMAVGVRPFQGPTLNDYLAQHTTQQAPWAKNIKGDMPDGLPELLSRALEKDPARRFPSASVFRRDLMAIYRLSDVPSSPSNKSTQMGTSTAGLSTPKIDVGSSEQVILAERYRLERLVGEGGMGQVWLASDEAMDGQEVAIKILPPELWRDPEARENLKQEAKLSQRLSHPNVVRLMTLEPGEPAFIVMEYVPGPTLAAELIRRKFEDMPPFSPMEALPIIEGMAGALDLAHAKNVIHRDIKPSNILLDPQADGTFFPKLADFGIAAELSNYRARRTGAMPAGTLAYMSPEQLACGRIDGRSDLYSLGATIYQMMTFAPPYAGGDVAWAVANAPIPRPEGVPDKIAEFIVRCLSKSPDDRPASARELAREYRMSLGMDPHEISWPSIDPTNASATMARPRVTQGMRVPALPGQDVEATMPGYVVANTEHTMNAVPGSLDLERTRPPGARKRRRFAIGMLACMVAILGLSSSRTGLLGRLKEQLFSMGGEAFTLKLPPPGEQVNLARFVSEAEAGNAEAMRLLGVIYREGRNGPTKDEKQAFGWFKRAADAGHVKAAVDLGAAYARGSGIAKDDVKALEWFQKGADKGDPMGNFNLGLFHRNGRSTKADPKQALYFFQKAASGGSVPAMFQLGEMYLNGSGVDRDDKQAFEHFQKAAQGKHPLAQYLLGVMYAKGWGVKPDMVQAITWCDSAALQGLPEAQTWMAKYAPRH